MSTSGPALKGFGKKTTIRIPDTTLCSVLTGSTALGYSTPKDRMVRAGVKEKILEEPLQFGTATRRGEREVMHWNSIFEAYSRDFLNLKIFLQLLSGCCIPFSQIITVK